MRRTRKWLICALAALALLPVRASADGFALPASLTEIADNAFEGSAAIASVEIPDGVTRIGSAAFRDCASLGIVRLPDSVERLGAEAFAGCAEDLLICAGPDSAGATYAIANRIDYQAGTVYRALLLGNTYAQDLNLRLHGPENDVNAMKRCLVQFRGTPYEIRVRMNQTAGEMLQSIADTFSEATSADVSLLYYSGHGLISEDGTAQAALLGNDGAEVVTVSALRAVLDAIPGRKIIVIDACYSGGFIPEDAALEAGSGLGLAGTSEVDLSEAFVGSFTSAFSRRKRAVTADSYFVLTAAAADEESYEDLVNGQVMGLFTNSLVRGCGWDAASARMSALDADANGNDVLTLAELCDYTTRAVLPFGQHVRAYPTDCRWFGLLRKKYL